MNATTMTTTLFVLGATLGFPATMGCQPKDRTELAMQAAANSPLSSVTPPAPDERRLSGVVTEVASAGSYTYFRVGGDDRSHWVVTMGESVQVGDRVAVKNMGTKHGFRSRRLGRTFAALVFGIIEERG